MPEKTEQAHADHATAALAAPELSVSESQLPPAITPALAEPQQPVERRNSLMPNAVVLPLNTVLRNVAAPVSDWREFKPASISIEPRAGLEFEFEMSSVRTEHDRTIWTGENPDLPGAFLISVATETAWQAVLSYGSPVKGTFRIQASGDKAAVSELSGDISCGTPGHAAAGDSTALGDDILEGSLKPDGAMSAAMAAAGGVYNVDVLFFYDPHAVIFNTRDELKSAMIANIEAANRVLQRSLVNTFRWRFVECYEVPAYATPADLAGDVNLMRDQSSQVGGFIELKRKQHHADQCQLWVTFKRDDGYAGVGELNGIYSVVLLAYSGYVTVTHELGHNFGCHHDRLESGAGAQDGDGKYNYGWSIKEKDPKDESKELYFGTIMSYATTSVYNYFSNPNLTVEEYRTGTTYVIGVPTNEPQAAYNALVMRSNGPWMSIVGDDPAPPWILAQPQSVTMSVGASATLRVYVSSPVKAGNVRYQWRKGMSALTGATSDSFVILANSTNDNGMYYVDITNDSGSVTSNPAMVTVTTMPVPTTYSDTSGGGVPSLWYLSGMGLLFAAWLFKRKK
jgi:hypothetical protein